MLDFPLKGLRGTYRPQFLVLSEKLQSIGEVTVTAPRGSRRVGYSEGYENQPKVKGS